MKEHTKEIGNFLSTLVTALVVMIAILAVMGYVFGWKLFNIKTGSMMPNYSVGTLVVVKPVDAADLKPGDVITYVFNENGDTVTHRLVSIDAAAGTFVTKGDANNSNDSTESTANIVGKVVASVPGIGGIASFMTSSATRPWLIALIVLLIGVSVYLDFFRKDDDDQPKGRLRGE